MLKNSAHRYAVIMAGGTGTRLWPLSRQSKPKQFHKLLSGRTMIQETYTRIAKIVPESNIFISTAAKYQQIIRKQFPRMESRRLIIEPMAKNTAPAIGLATFHISRIDPQAIIATVASDHAIKNVDEFVKSIETAYQAVEMRPEVLTLIGIVPTYAHTGLGYIQIGKKLDASFSKPVFTAQGFKEKPDRETAQKYLESGGYLWNASYFIFSAEGMKKMFSSLLPETARILERVTEARNRSPKNRINEKDIEEIFSHIKEEAIDTAISEKLSPDARLVVPSELIWSDIGDWLTLASFFKEKYEGDDVSDNHIDYESENCFVQPWKRLIATVGLKDIIVIDTEDATLIAHKDKVQDIKKIIEELKKQGKVKHL